MPRLARLGTLLVALVIAWQSLKPPSPDESGGPALLRFLADLVLGNPDQHDKIGHFLAYAALAACAFIGFRSKAGIAITLSFAYGALFEGLQAMIPGRDASWLDMAANGTGVAAGLIAGILFSILAAGVLKK
ncbi:VanZ family protein [Parvularcula sp. ZS-1/3]|uniref:VanZ family protein n=1 Tax=Parvularcula mediterranea TaxID=2732508 RepID=A0A7Y3W4T5_9PROT|nr:VanZ family protein [Parvularcula mediterranea]NNU15546.1 VanZ family protein [Parvularcula mediterranea]